MWIIFFEFSILYILQVFFDKQIHVPDQKFKLFKEVSMMKLTFCPLSPCPITSSQRQLILLCVFQ